MGLFGGIAASVVGGLAQGRAASKAADAQEAAANRQIDLQERVYDEQKDLFKPFVRAGKRANKALMYELGLGALPTFGGGAPKVQTIGGALPASYAGSNINALGGTNPMAAGRAANKDPYNPSVATGGRAAPTQYSVKGKVFDNYEDAQAYAESLRKLGVEYGGFKATPGYDFRVSEGQKAIDRAAAIGGNLFSGATLKEGINFRDNMAADEYNAFYNRLAGMAAGGQNAAGMQGAAAQNYGAGTSNALANIGNAQAAGAIGTGNAINSAIGNGIGVWQYQNALGGGTQNAGIFDAPWASGGFWG